MVENAELYCSIDAGTSGVKVGLLDESGRLVRSAYRGYGARYPRPGWVEQPVVELWTAQCQALTELLAGIDPARIRAVACSSQRATVVGIDNSGQPTSTYLGWQDQRGLQQCDQLREQIGEQEYYRRTGLAIDTVASLSKILWTEQHTTPPARYAAHQSVLLYQLGVEDLLCAPSEASYVGLFDVTHNRWDAELAGSLGLDVDRLPTVVEAGTTVGEVSRQAADATGLPAGTPVVMGGGDLQLGALGIGAVNPGQVAGGIGTGGHCVAYTHTPLSDDQRRLNCLRHVAPDTWELEGLARAAGAAFRWLRDAFGDLEMAVGPRLDIDAYDVFTREAARHGPGAGGLILIPALAGLTTPMDAPSFSGTLMGLRLPHDRSAVIRAFMEGICYEQRGILESIRQVTGPVTQVRAWGGAAKSDLWCQIQADIYGVPVTRTTEPDASLVGAAVCAAVGVGAAESIQKAAEGMVTQERSWDPDSSAVDIYNEYFEAYQVAVTTLIESGLAARLGELPGAQSGGS